ncbi:MAG TPA: hypothetical protein VGP58_12890 [Pyrinomonadaceae bacterium]|nr:hypothetical protein [Pyrinomonadaceae bacterium]
MRVAEGDEQNMFASLTVKMFDAFSVGLSFCKKRRVALVSLA